MPQEKITILHYNDVYNVDQGKAARFLTAIKQFDSETPLVLFSGDALSPSMLSTLTSGAQMVPVLNAVGTHCAVFGNHDFDFGLEVLSKRVLDTNFPWLMSNVIDNETGRALGDGKVTHAVDWKSKRIGLIGLVEKEWLETLATINPDEVTYIDFVEAGQKLTSQLKQEGCDIVIALTHMRMPNDMKLAEKCDEIDLILGGHDHVYSVEIVNNKYIIKSGTDFDHFSKITLKFESGSHGFDITVDKIKVDEMYDADPDLSIELEQYTELIEGKMDEVLGEFNVELDGRFEMIRTSETNLGNWVCDVILAATKADLVILNSGTLRSDCIHPAGPFTMRDLMMIVPITDPLTVIELTGREIIEALENGVSMYPKLEGRFPQVAGISFAFYPGRTPGNRIERDLVKIGDEYLKPDSKYQLATKTYLRQGSDGYTVFKQAPIIVDEENCLELGLAIQNHFNAIKIRLGKTKQCSKHRQSLVTLSRRHSLVRMLDGGDLDGPTPLRKHLPNSDAVPEKVPRFSRRASLDELENESCLLTPRIERRIITLTEQLGKDLLAEKERSFSDTSIIPEENEISPQDYS
ncbi:uncharacterized protein LOC106662621 isoform X2 [Cimex lectularius]|nr:uncharacterized protein LOC106662621 isoform X2 [Cimex lectularius]XP_024081471.1 uncharacterized protein LOC106662621 isoform X2 [Cimex lectularius]XP_024081472.1 uncharacterized protein LOC106662621 isoform X2 [Cimex lectularius]